MAAPVTALLAYDVDFHEDFAQNYPVRPEMAERFRNDAAVAEKFAFQQSTLQGAYLIMAIRLGSMPARWVALTQIWPTKRSSRVRTGNPISCAISAMEIWRESRVPACTGTTSTKSAP